MPTAWAASKASAISTPRDNRVSISSGRRLGFTLKAGEGLRVTRNLPRQEFEGDEAMKPRVLGLIDHAHAAVPELLKDAVVRDSLVDHERRINSGLQS